MGNYIREADGTVRLTTDIIEWAQWFEGFERSLGRDKVSDAEVSTVFLGIDHSFGAGPPVLWETMVFGGEHDGYQERYTSEAAAIAGHERIFMALERGEDPEVAS